MPQMSRPTAAFQNDHEMRDESEEDGVIKDSYSEEQIGDRQRCFEHLDNLFERRVRQFKRLQKAVAEFQETLQL